MGDLTMADEEVMCDVEMGEPVTSADELSAKQCTDKWLEKMRHGVLSTSHFKEHWRTWVPRVYGPKQGESCLEWIVDVDRAKRLLFTTIEEFICNGGDPTTVLQNIGGVERPPSVCGRVFKVGEPTYSCRECGMDNTCVLCVDCFKQSEHRHHKYKMGTSSGGGCCDCGDTEAWKKAPFCNIHIVGKNLPDEPKKGLPEDMAERVRVAFEAVLWYAYELLSMEHSPRVPADLCSPDTDTDDISMNLNYNMDTFCTVLYNDETHTFEQVINTLTRVLKCNQKVAIEYVTNIDREGRAVVKCSSFTHCSDLKADIEKYTSRHGNRPLKVLVVHGHVVAHQMYAMRLLAWLQNFLSSYGEQFRCCFADVALKVKPQDTTIIEGVLVRDVHMWKSARAHWHRLLITGMLMEYDTKKALARTFTRKYGTVMKDFIRDDHDHSFSVSSLSVQIFTVPTLAHYLIAEEDALFSLLNAFTSECSRKCNREGRLEFERNVSNGSFKRAQYMLYDLRYLLGVVPEKWSDPLRKGFLQGLILVLNLLTMMQGMDAVSRQIGQHMEYEPEWESAFNLHIKLAYCVTLALEWCASDKVVLVKAYRATLKKLHENPCNGARSLAEVQEVADHSVACLPYDVSSRPVSIHLPLTRFLAGLHLHLEKHGLAFDSPELQAQARPSPEEIVEPVLRTQAMISQVHAGMWRRNGYALLNQLYFYHNVKCRTEMLDRDIVLLQMAASVIESNEFLVHALNKYGLVQWAHTDFEKSPDSSAATGEEDNMRQIISLVEEFLQLLTTVVGERHVPGVGRVTAQDRTKKEIIQQLCIKPLPHSELSKTLPDDVTHETALDDVVDQVATFKKPTQGTGKGVYELRPELHSQYNVFFYHYTREELSRSEEAQRKRRQAAGELECCPPPDLPQLCEQFSMLVNLLQCDVMLHLMSTVLERSANLRARSFSEPQLHKVLHLIGYALQEEESHRYPILTFTERARRRRIPELMEELSKSPRVDAHKDLLTWTIAKFKSVAGSLDSTSTEKEPSAQPNEMLKKPEPTSSETAASEKDRRAKLAAQRRAKIMAQMTAMQNTFIKENAKLFEEATNDQQSNASSSVSMVTESGPVEASLAGSTTAMDTVLTDVDIEPIALGTKQTARHCSERSYTCILCQEQQKVSQDGPVLVLAAFVQQATVLCQLRGESVPSPAPDEQSYLGANLGPAPHTSTCGHVMHSTCWQRYFDNVVMKEHRRPYRHRHPASFDVEKHEFLCPLCECLSNTVLPLIPPLCVLQPPKSINSSLSFDTWVHALMLTVNKKVELCHGTFKCAAATSGANCSCSGNPLTESLDECDTDTCSDITHRKFAPYPLENVQKELEMDDDDSYTQIYNTTHILELNEKLKSMIEHYALTTYTRGLSLNQNLEDQRVPLLVWKSCAYTIHTMETLLRDTGKPLLGHLSSRQSDCLESLTRIVSLFSTAWEHPGTMSAHAFRIAHHILEHDNSGPCLLDWDSFGILVALSMSLPYLHSHESSKHTPITAGGILEAHIFRLVFTSHIVKIIIQTDVTKLMDIEEDVAEEYDSEGEKAIHGILAALGRTSDGVSFRAVWRHIQNASLPFLRSCVLFYRYVTDIQSPEEFNEAGGDTFQSMCRYLGVPDTCGLLLLFGCNQINHLITRWCSHVRLQEVARNPTVCHIVEPLPVNSLVELPGDYSELINAVSLFTCPNSDREDSRNPTMCLVCGEMLCSQSYCCQIELNKNMVGACTYHAYKCGAGVGVFLRVRECEILFLASPMRGCFVIPPYLDDYGETDQGLRRGNPLRLCPERYRRLQALWLGHCIHEEIARAIESSTNLMSTQWQHL